MEEWHKPTSTLRVIFGTIFIIAALVFMIYYFSFVPFAISTKSNVWVGAMVICFFFLLGFYVGFDIKTKKVAAAALVLFVWSLGLLVIPVPEGYGEAVYGGWAILLMIIIALYVRHEKSTKKEKH